MSEREKPRVELIYDEECNRLRVHINGLSDYPKIPVRDFDQGNDARFQNELYQLIEDVWRRAYRSGANGVRAAIKDLLCNEVER
jgi:hypothetical protein